MKNLKLGKRLLISFLIVTILSSIGGIVGIVMIHHLGGAYSSALTNYGFSQGDVGHFNAEFARSRSYSKDVLLYTDAGDVQTALDKISQSNEKINQYMQKMKDTMVNQSETEYYNKIDEEFAEYLKVEQEALEKAEGSQKAEAFNLLKSKGSPLADQVQNNVDALLQLKTETGNQLNTSLSAQKTATERTILIVALVSIGISVLIATMISKGISRPVQAMVAASQKMAEGDLKAEIPMDNRRDEIGLLSTAFAKSNTSVQEYISDLSRNLEQIASGDLNIDSTLDYSGDYAELKRVCIKISKSLNEIMEEIAQAAEQVASGSEQVSVGAQTLAQSSTEQAGSVEELSMEISEISQHVKENAKNAAEADANVSQIREEVEDSNRQMDEMVVAMDQISESSGQIEKIIKAIEDIAFQTNILALNAAVEAARAGNAGKGFSVVADEVRNLASKSAGAAKNTTSLIENSIRQVENGTRAAKQTAEALRKVTESTKKVSEKVGQISQASNRQSEEVSQITQGINQISSVVQSNSATAEESAAASEELSGQAQVMKTLVAKFKLIPHADAGKRQNRDTANIAEPALTEQPVCAGKY